MAISPTFQRYLATKNVVYDIVVHEPTKSAMRTAEACGVSGDRVAKAVVLHDEYGYVLAILPASHQIRLDDLRRQLSLDVDLAAEYEIEELFDDCIPGAIPPVGECYGLETVVDDSIERQPEVYLEGGDHATLVHMSHAQFASLTATARHGTFSVHV
jgi:Ala-tRNA(Pro) deacylase